MHDETREPRSRTFDRFGLLRIRMFAFTVFTALLLTTNGSARVVSPGIPSAEVVQNLLKQEPFSLATWPSWKPRMLAWFDDRSRQTDAAFEAGRAFVLQQGGKDAVLTGDLAGDSLAWYFLGHGILYENDRRQDLEQYDRAERCLRKSIELDPNFGRPHRSLAMSYLARNGNDEPTRLKAENELQIAKRLSPSLNLHGMHAEIAMRRDRPADAEREFRAALAEEPNEPGYASGIAVALLRQDKRGSLRSSAIRELRGRFPDRGELTCCLGAALAFEDDIRGALQEFDRARSQGVDPRQILGDQLVQAVEDAGKPHWLERIGWAMLYFTIAYLIWMAIMAGTGLVLAGFTRGRHAVRLLGSQEQALVSNGQIARVGGETLLTRAYALMLFVGLVLFYVSLPFVIVGLIGGTFALLYGIFMLGRVPVKLVVVVGIVGLMMVWAVLKSIFSKMGRGSLGVAKTAEEIPKVYEALNETARRIDTRPVDEVYLSPGSEIGVHQEGRGPFGLFGVKNRVLTLGISALQGLSVGELKSILAHEYAHFSHGDTFFSRFIYQVQLSIDNALSGMGAAGGRLNYVNPFFWFLYLYHRSYHLLSAGFSRSREFLADRMACAVYGSDVFATALRKVCTEGVLFERVVYNGVEGWMESGDVSPNMYSYFRSHIGEKISADERKEFFEKSVREKGSLFASHPTFSERLEAIEDLPTARENDARPAMTLFDAPEKIEQELTDFMKGYVNAIHEYINAQAAAAQG